MATEQNGKLRGRVGNKIYSIDPVTKKQVVRSRPRKVRNPKSGAQQAHRNAFVEIVRLSSHMTEAHRIGLHRHAQRAHLRTYMLFRRLNKDCFNAKREIDYPHVVLSMGSLAPVLVIAATLGADGVLHLTFDAFLGKPQVNPDDSLYLFAYSETLEAGVLFPPVFRSSESVEVELPFAADGLHLYAFLRNRRGRCSPTVYIPLSPAAAVGTSDGVSAVTC